MHELSMMSGIVNAVEEEVKKRGATEVKEIKLEIGELTFLCTEQMQFAYEILSKDTILEEAKLDMEEKKAEVRCKDCDYVGKVEYMEDISCHIRFPMLFCPNCRSKNIEIISGKECTIKSIVIIVPDSTPTPSMK